MYLILTNEGPIVGLFNRRKPNEGAPSEPRPEEKPIELKWRSTSEIPRQHAEIVFDWLGTRFSGEYMNNTEPWNVSWLISAAFPYAFRTPQWISTNQIERWAYADGSE